MVYYFFPQPDCDYRLNAIQCSLELKAMMKRITQQWQSRKGWFSDLLLNIGLNEGQEWFGSFHAGGHVEFTVLGETINSASRVSDFARNGSVWVSKSMLNQIPSEKRKQISFGITRRTQQNESLFVTDTYASLGSLLEDEDCNNSKFRDVGMLPITELRDFTGDVSIDMA
jgi:class 3 adenylate cyclase